MHKRMIFSVVLVPLMLSPTWAVVQSQGFDIGTTTNLGVAGGAGQATNQTALVAGNNQFVEDLQAGVTTIQMESGGMYQGTGVGGAFGVLGAAQQGQAVGQQAQAADFYGNNQQDQALTTGFMQKLTKNGGIGAVTGMQGYVGAQIQIIASPFSVQANVSYAGINQYKSFGGGRDNGTNVAGALSIFRNRTYGN